MAWSGNTSTVIPAGGGDYSSLQAWVAAVAGDFVTATAGEKAVCSGSTADTDNVQLTGATTDASQYYWYITCDENHGGKWNTGNYRLEGNNSEAQVLDISDNNVRVENIQIDQKNYTNGDGIRTAMSSSQGHFLAERCIIRQTAGTATSGGVGIEIGWNANSGSGDFPQGSAISNCIIYDFYDGYDQTTSRTRYVYFCTVYGSVNNGFSASSGTLVTKCCVSQANSGSDFSGTQTGSDYNADEDSTATGSNSQTGTVSFVDTSTDDYHLAAGDTVAKGNGTDLSSDSAYPVSVDIENTTRPTSNVDIGADQTAASVGPEVELRRTMQSLLARYGILTALDLDVTYSIRGLEFELRRTMQNLLHRQAHLSALDVDVTYSLKTGRISALDADVTYDLKTGRISALDADITYDLKTGRISALDSDVTYSLKTGRISALDSDITYSLKTGRISALDSDITYSVKTGRVSALDLDLTYTTDASGVEFVLATTRSNLLKRVARLTAVDVDLTYSPKTGRVSALDADITYSLKTGRISALDADITYSTTESGIEFVLAATRAAMLRRVARLAAVDLDITYALKTGRVSAIDVDVTHSLKTGRITAVDLDVTHALKTGRITAVDLDITHALKTGRISAVDLDITHTLKTGRIVAIDADIVYILHRGRITALDIDLVYDITGAEVVDDNPVRVAGVRPARGLRPVRLVRREDFRRWNG